MKKVDMSEAAILRRLKTVDRLRELCLSLMKAKKESDAKAALEKQKSEQTNYDSVSGNGLGGEKQGRNDEKPDAFADKG